MQGRHLEIIQYVPPTIDTYKYCDYLAEPLLHAQHSHFKLCPDALASLLQGSLPVQPRLMDCVRKDWDFARKQQTFRQFAVRNVRVDLRATFSGENSIQFCGQFASCSCRNHGLLLSIHVGIFHVVALHVVRYLVFLFHIGRW